MTEDFELTKTEKIYLIGYMTKIALDESIKIGKFNDL